MVNTLEFAERLKKVMEYYGLNAASFAETISVNRSSISHLLSGRNKPSLDFVIKVIENFEEVELYWLLNGKGSFPRSESPTAAKSKTESQPEIQGSLEVSKVINKNAEGSPSEIEQIIIFYKDGSFRKYRPN